MDRLLNVRGRGHRRSRCRSFRATPLPRGHSPLGLASPSSSRGASPSLATSSSSSRGSSPALSSPRHTGATEVTVTLEMLYREWRAEKNKLDQKLSKVDDKIDKMSSVVKELKVLMKEHCKRSFAIKGSPYEVCINCNKLHTAFLSL